MTNQEFIKSIQEVDNVSEHYQFVKSLVNTDNGRLISIFDLIPKDWNYLLYNWQLRAAYENIINSICRNNNRESIQAASTIFERVERLLDKLKIASMLSSYHAADVLVGEVLRVKNDELLRLLIHELVSRGHDLRTSAQYDYLERINTESDFKTLCLYPLEQELQNTFPRYTENGSGYGHSFGFSYENEYEAIDDAIELNGQIRQQQEIAEAIDHWVKESGGISIGYRGKFNVDISVESIIRGVPELTQSTKIRLKSMDSTSAYQRLFDASSKGAAFSYGNMGAYGRLKSWRSLHSMMSGRDMESNRATSELMRQFEWLEFNTDYWFINEWCDFGLICINHQTGEFGLMAGTDTD